MMREKPTYLYYADEYRGMLGEDEFFASLAEAVAIVNDLIGLNQVEDATIAAYKNAVCAAVDRIAEYGNGESLTIGSFSIGGTGVSGTDSARASAVLQLSGSGLLWAGI